MIEYIFYENEHDKGLLNLGFFEQRTVYSGWGHLIVCYSLTTPCKLIAKFRLKAK